MSRIEHFSQMVAHTKQDWKSYLLKGLLAAGSIVLITGVRFIFRSDSLIYHVSWLDLLIVIALAIIFGRAIALVAAVTAFICLDFFFVQPLYTLQIKQSGDALTLVIFLLVAVSMCLCVSEVRRRYYKTRMSLALEKQKSIEDTAHRARPVSILYDTAKKTSHEKTLDAQLVVIAQAIVENFHSRGIHGITIFLPGKGDRPLAIASWPQMDEVTKFLDSSEVCHTAEWVIANNASTTLTVDGAFLIGKYGKHIRRIVPRASQKLYSAHHYACMMKPIPLIDGKRAALFLVLDDPDYASMFEQGAEWEGKDKNIEAWFLWQFVEHMVALIEKARLQDEKIRLELLQRTENIHSNLIKWVSHGIRTPLTSFLLETEKALIILQHKEPSNDDIRLALESMKSSVGRLDHFVDDFLDMTRAKGGILKPQKSLNYIDDLLDEALKGLQPVIANRHIDRDIPDDLPPLELDPTQIGHVLTNLIENAHRYTPPLASIEIRAHACNGYMRIEVADRGHGVLPTDRGHLFEEFYRGKAVAHGGKGLGLPTCKALVEAHEGNIGFEDRESGGTIFYFTLPLTCRGE